jgi:hypothetical protein
MPTIEVVDRAAELLTQKETDDAHANGCGIIRALIMIHMLDAFCTLHLIDSRHSIISQVVVGNTCLLWTYHVVQLLTLF